MTHLFIMRLSKDLTKTNDAWEDVKLTVAYILGDRINISCTQNTITNIGNDHFQIFFMSATTVEDCDKLILKNEDNSILGDVVDIFNIPPSFYDKLRVN